MTTKEYFRKRYIAKREEILAKQKIRYKKLKAEGLIQTYNPEYYRKNKDKALQNQRKYRSTKKGKLAYQKYYESKGRKTKYNWFQKNKKKIQLKKYNKLKTDPNFKMKHFLGNRIRKVLGGWIKKSKKTQELIGCTIEQLWIHLESKFQKGMTKENYGLWHVDHVRPCASFDLTDPKQQAICFHYTNLQPLWAIDNLKKGAKHETINA